MNTHDFLETQFGSNPLYNSSDAFTGLMLKQDP